jgi:hypothetical protein
VIDLALVAELEANLSKAGRVSRMDAEDSSAFLHKVATRYVANSKCRWWWQALSVSHRRLGYDGGSHGLEVLATLLDGKSDVVLVVTDDSDPPWPAFAGPSGAILGALRETRFFEFFIVSHDLNWVVFDAHHNELVVAGDLK